MAAERRLWQAIRDSSPAGDWHRVENTTEEGTPDVVFAIPGIGSGWLELKSVMFPVRDTSIVPVEFSSIEQVKWGLRWTVFGRGFYRLLIQDSRTGTLYLMRSQDGHRIYRGMPKMLLQESAQWAGTVRELVHGINVCFRRGER